MWWLAIRITKPQCGIFIKRRCQNGGLAGTDLMFLTCVCTSPGLKNLISGRPPMFPSSELLRMATAKRRVNATRARSPVATQRPVLQCGRLPRLR